MVARLKQNATKLCFAGVVLVAVLMALHHEGSMLSRYAEYVTSGMVEYSPTASGEAYNTRISHSHNTTTTSINQQRSPVLYLHVGPHKTATTTIQEALIRFKEELSNDSIAFMWRGDKERFSKDILCTSQKYRANRSNYSCLFTTRNVLESQIKLGNDFVFSDEFLGTELADTKDQNHLDQFRTLSKDWDVRIIMGYRPWFEYIVSRHNQYFKPDFAKPLMAFWPGEGGFVAPPIVDPSWTGRELVLNWTSTVNFTERPNKQFDINNAILGTYETFSSYFENVVVLDINEGDVLETLFCSVMENAATACNRYKSLEKARHANKATLLAYDQIACAAFQSKRFWFDGLTRKDVKYWVKHYHKKVRNRTFFDLPLVCPSEEYVKGLFETSLDIERKVFPNRTNHTSLEESFATFLSGKKLCHVNTTAVLADENWIALFQNLSISNREDSADEGDFSSKGGALSANWEDKKTKSPSVHKTISGNKQRTPVLYLHVGPHKTASSTIQTILTKLKNQLSKDSITFKGRYENQYFQKPITCQQLRYTRLRWSCLSSVFRQLDKAQRRGNDFVFSDEYLGTELSVTKGTSTFDLARTNLDELGTLSKDWDVRIIMGYRPWFEFVVSRHNQYFKPSFQKMSMAFWPGEGGYVAPPLVDPSWTGRELSLNWTLAVNATDKYGKLRKFDIDNTILGTFETFSAYFDKVVVLDIHQDGFLETLLCSVMENADKACSAYKRMEKTSHANEAMPFAYDQIACAAFQSKRFWLEGLTRKYVRHMVKHYHEDVRNHTLVDFPLVCPSKEYVEGLYATSLDIERKIFPNRTNHTWLEESFAKLLSGKKLCHVNTTAVLADEGWIALFQNATASYKEHNDRNNEAWRALFQNASASYKEYNDRSSN